MKIRIFNYLREDFLLFQEQLNQLSQSGYNPNTIGYITFLKKGERKYYLVTPFLSTASSRRDIAREKVAWLTTLSEKGCDYLGKVRGMYVFSSDEPIQEPLRYELLGEYFAKGQVLKRAMAALFFLVAGLLMALAIYNGDISEYLTNGRILLRFGFYLAIAGLVGINIINLVLAARLGQAFKFKEAVENFRPSSRLKLLRRIIAVAVVAVLAFGLVWDNFDNDLYLGDYDQFIQIDDLIDDANVVVEQYTTNHSYLIPYSYSLLQQAGNVDSDAGLLGDILKVGYYQFNDQELQADFFAGFQDLDDENLSSITEVEPGVWLGYDRDLGFGSNLYINIDDVVVVVYTNFDLEQDGRIATLGANYLVLK